MPLERFLPHLPDCPSCFKSLNQLVVAFTQWSELICASFPELVADHAIFLQTVLPRYSHVPLQETIEKVNWVLLQSAVDFLGSGSTNSLNGQHRQNSPALLMTLIEPIPVNSMFNHDTPFKHSQSAMPLTLAPISHPSVRFAATLSMSDNTNLSTSHTCGSSEQDEEENRTTEDLENTTLPRAPPPLHIIDAEYDTDSQNSSPSKIPRFFSWSRKMGSGQV